MTILSCSPPVVLHGDGVEGRSVHMNILFLQKLSTMESLQGGRTLSTDQMPLKDRREHALLLNTMSLKMITPAGLWPGTATD